MLSLATALLAGLLLPLSASAAPAAAHDALAVRDALPSQFYIVSTTQSTPERNSSHLADVSALNIFDPFDLPSYRIRTIGPGYNTLTKFSIDTSTGELTLRAMNPHGVGPYMTYRSRPVTADKNLLFTAKAVHTTESFSIKNGYLVTVGGKDNAFYLCKGGVGETVVRYMGTQKSCKPVYLQAVAKPPY